MSIQLVAAMATIAQAAGTGHNRHHHIIDDNQRLFPLTPPLRRHQVRELLSAFGPLKSFHLVRDPGSPTSKGYGFCEYISPGVTAIACEGLHGMTLGDKTLTVRPATDRG